VYLVYLEILWEFFYAWKVVFHLSVYTLGVYLPSNFLLDCVADTRASAGRVSLPALCCAPGFHCVVDCQLLLWVHVDHVHGHVGHLLPFL